MWGFITDCCFASFANSLIELCTVLKKCHRKHIDPWFNAFAGRLESLNAKLRLIQFPVIVPK